MPHRELRLLLHDAVVTGGALDVKQRALELDVAAGTLSLLEPAVS